MYPLSNGTNVIGITNDVMDTRYGIANTKNVGLEYERCRDAIAGI